MSQKKNLSIGTIREVTITPDNGEPFTKLEINLRQDVEVYVKGEKVNFSSFELKDGTELKNKKIDITPVEIAQEGAKKAMEAGRMTEEVYNDLVSRNERQNVRYNLSVSSRNLA